MFKKLRREREKGKMVEDKKTDSVVERDYKSEIKSLKEQPVKWTKPSSPFDHLPPHERPFNIQPFGNERSRLPFKMTDEDRLRRKKWIESQTLTDREPVHVEELERQIFNPIRRLYRAPADKVMKLLVPVVVRIILKKKLIFVSIFSFKLILGPIKS